MHSQSTKVYNWWLYVLRLEDGKFYVGITPKTPDIRMNEHINGVRAAYWTAKHKPLEVIYSKELGGTSKEAAEKQENTLTRQLMQQRGINNVRGGDLTSTNQYIARFGRIWEEDIWKVTTYAVYLMLTIIYLMIDKLFL